MSPTTRPAEVAKSLPGLAERKRLIAGLVLLLLAVGSSLASLLLFPREPQTGAAWAFHLAGIALFAVAIAVLFRVPKGKEPAEPLNYQVVIFGLIILGLAIFMRFYRLAELPFGTWYDEADLGLNAKRILTEPSFRPPYLPGLSIAYYFPALTALSLKWLGAATESIRTLTAVFGTGSVVVAFFLGREIYGNRFGLLMAFFLSVARWPVTLDRLSMPISSTGPFFLLLTLFLLFRGKRTSSVRYFGWAGLAAGFGLGFHNSLRLLPVIMLLFIAYRVGSHLRAHREERGWRIVWTANLAALAIGALLASGPLIQYAIREPAFFWNRAQQVSILNTRDEPNLAKAISSNTLKNVLMFNYEGDRNGRHNIPGEPLLDPITGALFVLGVVLALSRIRRHAEFLFVAIFVVGLSVAILTVDFEAPQAQRAIGAVPAVFFFSALAAEAYWRVLDRVTFPFWTRALGVFLLLAAGAAIVYLNTNAYFVRQANDDSVWQSHSAIETVTAKKLKELNLQGSTFYLSMYLHKHLVVEFLAPDVETKRIVGPDVVPLREPGDRPVVVMVDLQQDWIAQEVEAFYPNAKMNVTTSPGGLPMQYTVLVPPEDMRRVQGLEADYWPGDEPEGQPEISRIEDTLNTRWPAGAPLDEPFVAEWSGVLYAPEFREYQLLLQSPGAASVWLDCEQLIAAVVGGEHRLTQTLAQGNHTLRIQAESGDGVLRLAWIDPQDGQQETIPAWNLYHAPEVASQGLLAAFYEGGDWEAPPALERIDPVVDAYFHLTPLNRPYGAIWSGQIEAPQDGSYAFGLEVNGMAKLYVDDELILEASGPPEYKETMVDLSAGRHDLRLQFLDDVGGSRLHLYWTPPGQERRIIPGDALIPARQPGEVISTCE